jgi:phage terminase small subunit
MSDVEAPDLHLLQSVPAVSETGQIPGDDEGDTESLSARETSFVDALAAGATPREAATQVGISDRTGRRWRQKPEIQAAVRSRLNDSIAVAKSILASGAAKAATGLVAMASGEAEADAARVSACRATVEGATKLCELDELQARLSELESRLSEQPNRLPFRS